MAIELYWGFEMPAYMIALFVGVALVFILIAVGIGITRPIPEFEESSIDIHHKHELGPQLLV